jgi:hypothetical protein
MWLIFVRYGSKLYAQTPAGEYAYGDVSGLYEWRGSTRIHYSGGDRQASSSGGMHHHGPLLDTPFLRGLTAVMSKARLN